MFKGLNRSLLRTDLTWLIALVLPLVALLPTLGHGTIQTSDGTLHVHRIEAMRIMLTEGNLWPRWVPYFHLGFGYPIFNFYPPGTYLFGALLGVVGISAPAAFVLLSAFAWMLGSLGTFVLARRFLPVGGALLAALLWSYAPSRFHEVWVQGSLPQMLAAGLIPWLLAAMVAAAFHPSRRHVVAIALALAGVVLTHLPIAFITTLFVVPAAIILPSYAAYRRRERPYQRWAAVFGGLALGSALSAIFVLPMALELNYVRASLERPETINELMGNFLQVSDIFAPSELPDVTDLYTQPPTRLGLSSGLLALGGAAALLLQGRGGAALLLCGGVGLTLFMLLEVSLPVWTNVPFLVQIRYPDRFLRIGALLIALLGGSIVLLMPRWGRFVVPVAAAWVLLEAMPLIYGNFKPLVTWDTLTALDEIRYESETQVWGTTSYNEFRPLWGESITYSTDIPEPERYIHEPTHLSVYRIGASAPAPGSVEVLDESTLKLQLAEPQTVQIRQHFFPGWQATVNDQPAEVYPEPQHGLLTLDLPPGEHIVRFAYTGTPVQAAGTLISLLALGVTAILGLTGRRQTAQLGSPVGSRADARCGLVLGTSIAMLAVFNAGFIQPQTLWFRQRSPADQPVYQEISVQQSFGGLFTLNGYTLKQQTVAPGQTLNVRLFWRADGPLEHRYRPIVQLVDESVTEAWAVSEPPFPGVRATEFTMGRFASDFHRLRVFDSVPSGLGRVSVQMWDDRAGEFLLLPDGSDRLLLDAVVQIDEER